MQCREKARWALDAEEEVQHQEHGRRAVLSSLSAKAALPESTSEENCTTVYLKYLQSITASPFLTPSEKAYLSKGTVTKVVKTRDASSYRIKGT